MKQFNMYCNQMCNICIWFNTNTRMKASMMYDGDSIHIELSENDIHICDKTVDNITVKSDERLNLELKRLIEYLLMLKKEQELDGNK